VCQLVSWFNGYCLVRTYSNCMEALLTIAGVYYWLPCQGQVSGATSASSSERSRQQGRPAGGLLHRPPHQRAWLACAALSVVFRPSSALFWTLPAALQLLQQQGRGLLLLLWDAATVGGGLLAAAVLVDRVGYGR
jgi:phosphatidylinositol glycan class B